MEIIWNETSENKWESLCDRALAPMPQRWIYGEIHAALGGQVHRAVIWENDKPVGLCQCLCRKGAGLMNIALATRGPIWLMSCDQKMAIAMIRRTLPLPHPRLNLFSLTSPIQSFRSITLLSPATFAECALPATSGNLHGKWRNALKKAGKFDLETNHKVCSSRDLDAFLAKDMLQQKAKSYRALPPSFTRKWHVLSAGDLQFHQVLENDKVIAQALFIQHGTTATYHIAHISARARIISAGQLLLWRAFQDLTTKGVCRIDLGMIDTVNAPGLARFKLGSGAKARQMGPTILAF